MLRWLGSSGSGMCDWFGQATVEKQMIIEGHNHSWNLVREQGWLAIYAWDDEDPSAFLEGRGLTLTHIAGEQDE